MARSSASVAAVLTAALLLAGAAGVAGAGAAVMAGCAVSAPADLTPDIDPNLPGIEAGRDPLPAAGPSDPPSSGQPAEDAAAPSDAAAAGDSPVKPLAPVEAGVDAAPKLAKPSPGELLVTELMYDSFGSEPASEWIELHSKASVVRMLEGLTVEDGGGRTYVLGGGLTIAPGAYVLLVRNKASALAGKVPSAAIVVEYGTGLPDNAGVLLANGDSGGLSVRNGPVVLAKVPYGGWFSQSGGSSLQLDVLEATSSATKSSWCLSLNAWTTGSEKGTPGAPNDCL